MNHSKQIVTAGMLIALGLVLPIAFHTFALGGPTFLPMHLPVLLGGFLLSPFYALFVGAVTPFLSSVMTGMPIFFPGAIQMIFELAAYGFLISYLYNQRKMGIYPVLITGMAGGRVIAGFVNYILLTQFMAKAFTVKIYLMAAFVTALPGIVIQIITIPFLVNALVKTHFMTGMPERKNR